MNGFVDECRREWRRLGVADPVAAEMAAELAADLEEAEAEGASAEDVLGGGIDPRAFARTWAGERRVIPSQGRWTARLPAASADDHRVRLHRASPASAGSALRLDRKRPAHATRRVRKHCGQPGRDLGGRWRRSARRADLRVDSNSRGQGPHRRLGPAERRSRGDPASHALVVAVRPGQVAARRRRAAGRPRVLAQLRIEARSSPAARRSTVSRQPSCACDHQPCRSSERLTGSST